MAALTLAVAGLALPAAVPPAAAATTATIENYDAGGNQVTKFDTDGNATDAHEPYIAQFGGTYYLYGTSTGCGSLADFPNGGTTPFCGDKVYSSPDLTNWTYRGYLFDAINSSTWQSRCQVVNPYSAYPHQSSCFRPKVVYNAKNNNYVLWVNLGVNANEASYNPKSTGKYFVLTSSSPTGPFTEVGVASLAQQWDNDETLFVDDDAARTAYVVYMQQVHTDSSGASVEHQLVAEKLNADYTSGTGVHQYVSRSTVSTVNGGGRSEAPTVFKRNGLYYLVYSSPPCGFCHDTADAPDTEYKTTATPLTSATWSAPRQITSHVAGSSNYCPGQSSTVTQVGGDYLFQFDLWDKTSGSPAPSNVFFGRLSFNSDGSIQPLRCSDQATVSLSLPNATAGGPTPPSNTDQDSGSSRFRHHCDLQDNRTRAQTFTPSAAAVGKTMDVAVSVSRQGPINAPLQLEIRKADASGPLPGVLATASIDPGQVSWNARYVTVHLDQNVAAGQMYAVVLRSTTSGSCYAIERQDGALYSRGAEYFSGDGGGSWSGAEFDLKFRTLIGAASTGGGTTSSSAAYAFEEGNGSTAADGSGSGNTATLQGGAGWTTRDGGGNALALNGTTAYASTTGPVIDTSQSFTVSAWVRLDRVDNNAYVASSVDGVQHSGFYLEYCGFCGNGAFDLTMVNSDTVGTAAVRATGTTHPVAGTWYHLVGVYDRGAGTLRLLVNGTQEANSSFSSPWNATGSTAIGRGKHNGSPSNFWPGALDDVRFNNGVLA